MLQSRTIDILNELDRTHGLKNLFEKGFITWSVIWHRDVYNEFDVYRRLGNNVAESVLLTSVKLNTSQKTVYKAIKRMKS